MIPQLKPTRTRYQASGFLFALAAVTYLDRVCISTLAPQISRDLHLSKLEMSFVFSAFAVAYAAFEIVSAWWGEQIGARRVLARIVIWWSAFTMATAAAWSYSSLLVDPLPLRRRRGRRVAQCRAGLLALDSAARTRPRAGLLLRRRPRLRRHHAPARRLAAHLPSLARHLPALRTGRRNLVGLLVPLVPRRTPRPSRRQPGRGAPHRIRTPPRQATRTMARRSGWRWPLPRTSGASASPIFPTATALTS